MTRTGKAAGAAAAVVGMAAFAVAHPAAGGEPVPRRSATIAPAVRQLVGFPLRVAVQEKVRARATTVRVSGRRCALATGTPLAALVRSRPGRLGLRDFGSCTRRARDGGEPVRAIDPDRPQPRRGRLGLQGGSRRPRAGARDPAGPFGRGRLRTGQRVTWFYGREARATSSARWSCGRRPGRRHGLGARDRLRRPRQGSRGRRRRGAPGRSDRDRRRRGPRSFTAAPGRYGIRATRAGDVRTYPQKVTVR